MRNLFKVLILVCLYTGLDIPYLSAQVTCEFPPAILWDKTIGKYAQNYHTSTLLLPDGGFLLGGYSFPAKSGSPITSIEYRIARLDAQGNTIWDKTLRGTRSDYLTSMLLLPDGNYLLGGYSNSDVYGEKTEPARARTQDYWVVKMDPQGNVLWDRTYGGNAYEQLETMVLLPDGGILLGGYSYSNISGEKTQNSYGIADYWIVKINAQGNKQWDKTIGGNNDDFLYDILLLPDGGFLLGGESSSNASGFKSQASRGGVDYWIVRTDAEGNKLWDRTLGGSITEQWGDMVLLPDGSFLLGGSSNSSPSGDRTAPFKSQGFMDFWLVKADAQGGKIWDKAYGGTDNDGLQDILMLPDGNLILGGYTLSNTSGDKSENLKGVGPDYWLLKINAQGNKLWDKALGGLGNDRFSNIILLQNGEYLVSGASSSPASSDKSEGLTYTEDFWILRLSENIPLTLKAYLINADTDQVIREIKDGDQIQEETLGTKNLTIEIRANKGDIGSMKIQLNGTVQIQKNENLTPYSLFGKIPPFDFQGGTIPLGQYSLTATPYCANNLQGTQGDPLNINFSILKEIPSPVSRFVLVNAQTGQDIQEIKEGDVIDLDQVGTNFLSIRAESNGAKFGSLFLELKGNQSNYTRTENIAPYTLFGDQGPQYYGRNICPGNYSMKATPYTGTNKTGTAQKPLEIKFQIKGASYLNIQSLTLINAGTNQDIAPLTDGMKITQIPAGISIRANADPCVESLYFLVRDSIPGEANLYHVFVAQVENTAPYALRGDGPGGDYYPWYPEPGKYILEVIANSADQFRGVSGVKKIIRFEILAPNATSQLESSTVMSLYPNPSSQDEVHLSLDMHWTGKAQLIVRDKQGNVILSKSISDQEIDLNTQTLKPGYYLIEVQTAEGVFRKPLIKN